MKKKTLTFRTFRELREGLNLTQQHLAYALGVIGWAIVIYNAPFGWSVPNYAAF